MTESFLKDSIQLFEYYRSLGQKSLDQVPEEKLFWAYNEDSNSLSTMVKHLWGNMLSRWTDFLTSDGEKEWRQREAEFQSTFKSRAEVMKHYNEGWDCLLNALNQLEGKDIESTIYIRNKGHLVMEAIQRQLGHYSYHIGQIVFLSKMVVGSDWKSLSIPKGKSADFNKTQFAKPKRREHFTDDLLDKND